MIVFAGCMSGCDPLTYGQTTLLEPDQAPMAERGALSVDNRFFVASGNQILELLPQPDGSHQTQVVHQRDDCAFSGMAANGSKIYAACTCLGSAMELNGQSMGMPGGMPGGMPAWSDLIRIDLQRAPTDPNFIATTQLGDDKLYPNGMAVDDRGDIYITNTFAVIFQMLSLFPPEMVDAITRVRITDEENFTITKRTALPSTMGGLTPNGIQIKGDRLWFVSMNVLYKARIGYYGLYDLGVVYTTDIMHMFDDFAILPGNVVAITEFNTMATMLATFFPDAGPPASDPSQLTFVSTGPGPYAWFSGEVVRRHILPGIIPSSATAVEDTAGPALYVTDFFQGGLYRVPLD